MSAPDDPSPLRRLRVPAALAVAFVASSSAVSIWYGGCEASGPDPVPDVGRLEMIIDAQTDAEVDDADVDAAARIDAAPPDTPVG